jgi:hypothetical protein
MKLQTSFALLAFSALLPCAVVSAQDPPASTQALIQIPARVKPAMEAAFKDGKSYFIWLVKDTNTFRAERDGLPFPHALIECHCVGNPKQTNAKFKSTIEMVTASKGDVVDARTGYADTDLQKDAGWWKDAQGGKPVGIIFAYVPQDRVLKGTSQVKLYLTNSADTKSHQPVSNVLTVTLEIPE